jgi:hypothetical protein
MTDSPLKPLHTEMTLVQSKLDYFSQRSTEDLKLSLQAGAKDSLKAPPDGTILDGHPQDRNSSIQRRRC